MRPVYDLQAEEYREKVQAFLAEKLPSNWQGIGSMEGKAVEEFVAQWRNILATSPYLAPGWPVEYGGGGLSALEQVIVAEEFARAGVPTGSFNDTFGIQMLGNTLLIWGTEQQKRDYLPRIISGQDVWCQGYSEPNAGSDLGNVGLKAALDGDQFILNGQKFGLQPGSMQPIFLLSRAPTPMHRSTKVFRSCWSICANQASKFDRSRCCRVRANSTRCFIQMRHARRTTSSVG